MTDNHHLDAVAERHNLSASAVQALADALAASGGGAAQWNHPDLGGMGQWFRGGMLQIGDMFNNDLKARVGAALDDLSRRSETGRGGAAQASTDVGGHSDWWPADFGYPSQVGSQNTMRYACFPDKKRLVIERDGVTRVYDTGSYRLTGVSQAQGGSQTLVFSGPDGRVTLDDLSIAS